MIKSMTAYGRASLCSKFGKFIVEVHSVNRKINDISLYLPKDFLCFDIKIRKMLTKYVERGQITLRLNIQNSEDSDQLFSNHLTQLKRLKKTWDKLAFEVGYEPSKAIDLQFLISQMHPVSISESKDEEEEIWVNLTQVIELALDDFMKMRETEGRALSSDIQSRLDTIKKTLDLIESKKSQPLNNYRRKIIERLQEFGQVLPEIEERISREIALLAEKMDITEEIVRIRVHIEQFYAHLSSKEKSVGRTLDFLTQEMHREINTLSSKSADSEISSNVLTLKSELDKIREQVQNIE